MPCSFLCATLPLTSPLHMLTRILSVLGAYDSTPSLDFFMMEKWRTGKRPPSDCGKQYYAKPGNTSAVWLVLIFFFTLISIPESYNTHIPLFGGERNIPLPPQKNINKHKEKKYSFDTSVPFHSPETIWCPLLTV